MNIDPTIIKAFEISPAVVSLLAVVFLQYKQLRAKDTTIEKLIEISEDDAEHHSKVLTLLQVLVDRGK